MHWYALHASAWHCLTETDDNTMMYELSKQMQYLNTLFLSLLLQLTWFLAKFLQWTRLNTHLIFNCRIILSAQLSIISFMYILLMLNILTQEYLNLLDVHILFEDLSGLEDFLIEPDVFLDSNRNGFKRNWLMQRIMLNGLLWCFCVERSREGLINTCCFWGQDNQLFE